MSLNKIFKDRYLQVFIVVIIFLLDRISKLYVIHWDKINLNPEIYSSKYLNIHLIWNQGIAFGFLTFKGDYLYNSLTLLIIVVLIIILFEIINSHGLKKYTFLIIFGGAIGNLFDRLVYKAVPDFLDFHVGDFHWFIFNIADVFITLGIITLIYYELFLTGKYDI